MDLEYVENWAATTGVLLYSVAILVAGCFAVVGRRRTALRIFCGGAVLFVALLGTSFLAFLRQTQFEGCRA